VPFWRSTAALRYEDRSARQPPRQKEFEMNAPEIPQVRNARIGLSYGSGPNRWSGVQSGPCVQLGIQSTSTPYINQQEFSHAWPNVLFSDRHCVRMIPRQHHMRLCAVESDVE
jgi:hypothetical protein